MHRRIAGPSPLSSTIASDLVDLLGGVSRSRSMDWFLLAEGERLRIVAIATDTSEELVEKDFNAVWVVEPA